MSTLAQDPELLRDYLAECDELLQRTDQDLVALEEESAEGANGAAYSELINRIFRAIHTIKGTSGFMGLEHVVTLAHHGEDVLNVLRKQTAPPAQATMRPVMDALLATRDQLARMTDDVRNNTIKEYNLDPLINRLKGLLADLERDEQGPRLGEIMMVEQVISREELHESLAEAAWDGRKLGEVLVDKKLASPAQVEEALGKQVDPVKTQNTQRTIRVDTTKLDDLLNLVGELVLERNRLTRLCSDLRNGVVDADQMSDSLADSTSRLSSITEQLQSASLRTRMVPIDMAFRRFPRLVRDIAKNVGKDVELTIRGENTELDKNVVEQISDPLVHLLRNALDHGIESPADRIAAGKPPQGSILLEAQQEGDYIVIAVCDDGRGMDPEKIGRKAIERGLISKERLASMNNLEITNLIFLPGFSTADKVSDLSGRGVGMDVVRSSLEKLNGVVEIHSVPGEGSLVRLKLPLTLAILPVLLVEVRTQTYALPLRAVQEIVKVPRNQTHKLGRSEMFRLRDRVIPLQDLGRRFHLPQNGHQADNSDIIVVILAGVEKRTGVIVDRLLGQEETVVKPLGSYLGHLPGLGGATISGDGQVRLILDPMALLDSDVANLEEAA